MVSKFATSSTSGYWDSRAGFLNGSDAMQGSLLMAAASPTRSLLYHGGDLKSAQSRFGPHRWLDLSTGLNPFAYPLPVIPKQLWARLPDRDLIADLIAAAAAAYGLDDADVVVAGPGSQAFIHLIPRLLPPGRVVVLGPTYAEHGAAWAAAGHRVGLVTAKDVDGALRDADTLVLTRPNNPDGCCYGRGRLRDWRRRLAAHGGQMVIDEAFADLLPELSLASEAGTPGLIVLRSFGKFFGLGGLRLGFGLCAPDFATRLREALGPWPISGPAAYVGGRAFRDRAWIAATRTKLREAAAALDQILTEAGLEVIGGTDLFRLVRDDDASALFERLARRGIWVRDFPEQPHWLRFGLPGGEAACSRLERALLAKSKIAGNLAGGGKRA